MLILIFACKRWTAAYSWEAVLTFSMLPLYPPKAYLNPTIRTTESFNAVIAQTEI